MQRHQLAVQAENDWLTVRRDLDELAHAYNVDVELEQSPLHSRSSDARDSIIASQGRTNWRRSRGDDPARAAERAARTLPSDQRQVPTSAS